MEESFARDKMGKSKVFFSSLVDIRACEEDARREMLCTLYFEQIKNEYSSLRSVNKDMEFSSLVTIFDLDLKNLFYIITSTVSNFSLRESRRGREKKEEKRKREESPQKDFPVDLDLAIPNG